MLHKQETDTPTEQPPNPSAARIPFRDLTLWQVLWLFIYRPGATLRRFFDEIALPLPDIEEWKPDFAPPESVTEPPLDDILLIETEAPSEDDIPQIAEAAPHEPEPLSTDPRLDWLVLVGMGLALIFALIGGSRLWRAAILQSDSLNSAPLWFWLAGLTYFGANLAASLPWWEARFMPGKKSPESDTDSSVSAEMNTSEDDALPDEKAPPRNNPVWVANFFAGVERHSVRLAMMPVGLVLAYLAYTQNVIYDSTGLNARDVVLTTNGTVAWILAILVWFGVLAVDMNTLFSRLYPRLAGAGAWRQRGKWLIRLWAWRLGWQHIALLMIMLLAAYFRLHDLSGAPPEMTSDHIEKLLDSVRVSQGYKGIFFPNNAGREGFQMHFIAALVKYTPLDFSFDTLKIATVIEGMLTVLLGYWLGMVMMGRDSAEDRRMGIWLGLSFSALLAISSWHTMLSRLGLRIALTPLTTVLVLIFLMRAIRYNRRLDYVWLGVVLGAGTYFYQANRMLPLVVVIGVALAAAVYARGWEEARRYAVNLACAGVMAFVIFLPMMRYGQAFPEHFWDRTRGRLFGEDAFIRENPETGLMETYEPGLSEQFNLFRQEWDVFKENYVDALEMWSWRGDGAWINNGLNRPALDRYTDGLFLLGLLAWLILFLRKWDMGHLVIPIGIVIMLLPTALTLAYQIENPSFTRASGTIPFVFLIAAYPLAQFGFYAQRAAKRTPLGLGLAALIIVPVIALAARQNFTNYFDTYRTHYSNSWKPYHDIAEPLREFAQGEGSYGNAFMIAYPHWLDHRILGTTAGDIHWNNGLVNREDFYSFIQLNQGTPYQYDPSKPLFFMYNRDDTESGEWLKQQFPNGEEHVEVIVDRPDLSFNVFIAPPNQNVQRR